MSVGDKARDYARRQAKHLGQVRYGWGRDKRLGFVLGCQRSGTKMLMWVLDRSPSTRIYHEDDGVAFDEDFLLRPDPVIKALVAVSPAPSQVFKPICDSHRGPELLERFPGSRALWLYRDADEVAASAVEKWGAHQAEVVRDLVAGRIEPWGWRTEDVPDEVVEALRGVVREDLEPHEGALLFWYLRNAFFFARGLGDDRRVRLARYQDLVERPEEAFPPVFAHLGATFEPSFVDQVHSNSVGRREPPPVHPDIRALVDGLQARLDAHVAEQAPPPLVSPVLMAINTMGTGGAERYVATVSNWMVERGARVAVVSAGGALEKTLDPRVEVIRMDLQRVRGDLPAAAMELRKVMRELEPAVVVAHSLVTSWVARTAQLRRRVPIVTVGHGWPAERYARVGKLIGVADKVVAVSPDVKRKLVDNGLSESRCTVIYNGVDTRPFHRREPEERQAVRDSLGVGPDERLVINVGRLSEQKAQHHILQVAARLREDHPRLRYAIVGDGERREELQALVEELGIGDIFTLTGVRRDVPELLSAADLFLSSSDWEGMPLSTIEAMASQLPIVATHTEGADQLLTQECAIVVPVGDAEALARAVGELDQDDDRREGMGEAARARALEHFSHERMSAELADLILRVAGG